MADHAAGDDFLDQILGFPSDAGALVPSLAGNQSSSSPMMLQLNSAGGGVGLMNASGSVKIFPDHVVNDTRLSSSVSTIIFYDTVAKPQFLVKNQ